MGVAVTLQYWNTSVLNHEGEPMDITKSTCKLCAIVMAVKRLNFSHTESESKKTDGVF